MGPYRIIDANINRVSEGLRVIEDIERFIFENEEIAKKLRKARHLVRKSFSSSKLIQNRSSLTDIGLKISRENVLDEKENVHGLLLSNFKRVEEGLRSIEECLKIIGHYEESKIYEQLRFKVYDLEKQVFFKNIPETDIYGITGEKFSNGKTNIAIARQMISSGIKIIQYREKDKNKREKYEDCKKIRKMTKEKNVTFIVNDDVDIAILVKADGVHIGQEDIPIEEVKKIVPDMIVGLSTHNKEQAKEAVDKGADYIGVGPIFNTTTKKNIEKSEGLKYLKWVSENINIPHVAIGGIKEENIVSAKSYGGKCFAMISEVVGAKNMEEKVSSIRKKLNEGEF